MPPESETMEPADDENPEPMRIEAGHDTNVEMKEASNDEEPSLTRQHIWNLTFCLLAYGFTVANVTLGKYTIH